MYFKPEYIDELQSVVSIEDVVRATGHSIRGRGKSKGVNHCPKCGRDWTHIKINTSKNLFNCYSPSCGFKGNQFQWIMYVEQVSFPDAVKRVAEIGNYPLPLDNGQELSREILRRKCLEDTLKFYQKHFNPDYLIKRRIPEELQKRYKIGYAPGGMELKKYLLQLGYKRDLLEELGLIRQVNGHGMDRFFKRVIIPIYQNGVITDLYGRSIEENATYPHLYLFGQRIAFGLDDIVPGLPVILVESIINDLTLKTHGILNGLAIGGAGKFDTYHIYQLKKKGIKEIIIGFDTGDENGAGRDAAIETGLMSVENGFDVKVLEMPKGIDINEFFKLYSKKEFQILLNNAVPFKKYHTFFLLGQMEREHIEEYLNLRVNS